MQKIKQLEAKRARLDSFFENIWVCRYFRTVVQRLAHFVSCWAETLLVTFPVEYTSPIVTCEVTWGHFFFTGSWGFVDLEPFFTFTNLISLPIENTPSVWARKFTWSHFFFTRFRILIDFKAIVAFTNLISLPVENTATIFTLKLTGGYFG